MDERNYQDGLRVRDRRKNTRAYIDNEFFDKGYARFLRRYFIVYACLAKFANAQTQTCFPSYERIMKETGIKSRNMLAEAITVLAYFGFIEIRPSKGRRSNRYYLLHHSKWWPPNSITRDTVLAVSKSGRKQYRKSGRNSIVGDTGNQRMKSEKEVPLEAVNKLKEMRRAVIASKRIPPVD